MKKKKIVYVGLSADILHEGHINILKIANSYGNVVVGLLTDEAIASYKKIPYLDFKQRKIVLENMRFVKKNAHYLIRPYTSLYLTISLSFNIDPI